MDGHADIPPSYYGLSQYPTTPYGYGGDESSNRATMPPPHGTSELAPLPPCLQFPQTGQPSQYGSQNFIPGSFPSQSMLSQPMLPYPTPNSYAGGSGSSLPSSHFSLPRSYRDFPSAMVANNDMAFPPMTPYMMPNSSSAGSSLQAYTRASSDNNIVSGCNSLLAQNSRIYPKPIEMPVGVRSQNKSFGENSYIHEDVYVDVSNGNKRRAGNEIAPPSRMWRSVLADNSFNEWWSVGDEPPSLPPQGVSVDVGNDNAYGGVFTPYQLSKIAACDELKAMAVSDPKRLKRKLSNREAAARSKEKKDLYLSQLEVQVETLETQVDTLTAELKLVKRERMKADDECVRLRTHLDGEAQAILIDDWNKHLIREVHRLTEEVSRVREDKASGEREEMSRLREEVSRLREEVSEYRRRESERMNANNMLEQLNINQQTKYNFE